MPKTRSRPPAVWALCLLCFCSFVACGEGEAPPEAVVDAASAASVDTMRIVQIDERFESEAAPADNVDGMAFWHGGADQWWIIAAAKDADHLKIYDATTGELLRYVGGPGVGAGQYRRPHHLAVIGDLLLVVERDNARVHVLRLPELEPLGWFGDGVLLRPYGIGTVRGTGGEAIEVYVGDNYSTSPGQALDLRQRIKHFRFRVVRGRVESELVRSFGVSSGAGSLMRIETLVVDPALRRLVIVEGTEGHLMVYTLEGELETVHASASRSETEALALVSCAGDDGYLIVSGDEFSMAMFQVLDRQTFAPVGTFVGRRTRNADGIAASGGPLPNFPQGALFATNNDQSVVAFGWDDIVTAMSLRSDCATPSTWPGIPAG